MEIVNKKCESGLQLMPDISTKNENNSLCLISSEDSSICGNDAISRDCHAINDHLNRNEKKQGKRILPSSFQLHAYSSSRKIKGSCGKPSSSKNHDQSEVNQSVVSEAEQDDENSKSSNAQRILPQLVAIEKNTDAAGNNSGAGEKTLIVYDERAIYEETLKNLAEPKFFANISEELLSVSLLFHQKVALAWMIQKEKSTHCAGGILADDQGLGKTISMIALILKQRALQSKFKANNIKPARRETLNLDDDEEDDNITSVPTSSNWKPAAGTLIVCPGTVLRQWARELDEKVNKRSKLSVLTYHGGKRTRDPRHLTKYDVVLTTYPIVTNEVVKLPLDFDGDGEQTNLDEDKSRGCSVKKRKFCSSNKNRKKIANMVNDSYFDSDNGPLGRVRWFRVILDEAQTIKNHQTKVARACSGLRARSRWCLSGTPVQNSIDDLYSYFRFLRYEPYAAYSSFCNLIRGPISQNASYGCKKLQAVLNTVLLRRTKDTLINQAPIAKLPPKKVFLKKVDFSPEERLFYKKLEEEARQLVKEYAVAGTTKKNYTSILLMILRLRQACSHPLLVKHYNTDTVGKGSLEMANQLPKNKLSKLVNQLEESQAICHVCNDPPENAVVTICGHVFCDQCVSERLSGDDHMCLAPGCKEKLSTELVFSRSTLQKCTFNQDDTKYDASSKSTNNADCSLFQSSYVSSKIKAALEILNELCSPDSVGGSNEWNEWDNTVPVKAIVFSQWNGMLNLFEKSLKQSHIQYRRLDGSMSLALRDKAVMEFNSNPKVTVMLMALKAGNLGLNMVAASHVILLDLWWNPSAEDQAIDRAHRIGQTRPVSVTRITIKHTVEDRILALQEEKRRLVSSALGEDKISTRARRLTMKDLKYLFKA